MECQILPRGDRKYFQLAHCQKIDVQSCFTVSRLHVMLEKKKEVSIREQKGIFSIMTQLPLVFGKKQWLKYLQLNIF